MKSRTLLSILLLTAASAAFASQVKMQHETTCSKKLIYKTAYQSIERLHQSALKGNLSHAFAWGLLIYLNKAISQRDSYNSLQTGFKQSMTILQDFSLLDDTKKFSHPLINNAFLDYLDEQILQSKTTNESVIIRQAACQSIAILHQEATRSLPHALAWSTLKNWVKYIARGQRDPLILYGDSDYTDNKQTREILQDLNLFYQEDSSNAGSLTHQEIS